MMKKRLSKKIWYGSDVDSEGKPVLPPLAKDSDDLEGLHYGELYLHIADDKLSLWTRTLTDQIKQIGGEGSGGGLWKLMETESGEKYIFSAFGVATQKDFVSFADGKMVDLPTLYDGLPIDNQTLKWKEVTNEDGSITRVLESVGSGGTADKVTWANIEGKPTWIGDSKPSYSWTEITGKPSWIGSSKPTYSYSEITEKPDLSDMATKTWVDDNYFSINGGQLHGDLWLRSGTENYGRRIIFGDKKSSGDPYVYIGEDSDDDLTIFATDKIEIKVSDGSVLRYDKAKGYWELDGDLLVTGGITSYE